MEAPSARYILSRAIFLIVVLVTVIYGASYVKKYQRKSAIVSELKLLCSDSSYFNQFYEEDARKSLLKAVALVAEANQLGMPPDKSIDGGLGIKNKYFAEDGDRDEPPIRQSLIRTNLRANYQNFLKLGYQPDFQTLTTLREGTLPTIPDGPQAGQKAEVTPLIASSYSPGIEKVIANLEIRPPGSTGRALTDIELAAAKQLARDLASANIIEEGVGTEIVAKLSNSGKPAEKSEVPSPAAP